jgi:phosphoribosyl 1,2-cyclic phosphodiesterase
LEFSVLASGSKANSVFVRSGQTRILIDCGLSKRELSRRLSLISVDANELTAVVISHEHEDHIGGVRVLSRQTDVPVYINEPTFCASSKLQEISLHQIYFFHEGVPFTIGELRLYPFQVSHDAAHTVGFKVENGEKSLCIVSDLGVFTDEILGIASGSDAVLLESNHEVEQLWLSAYPWELKERIASPLGHLSNEDASRFVHQLIQMNGHRNLKFLGAAHVSENSNTYDRALQAIKSSWKGNDYMPHCFVAEQREGSELFRL